MNAEPTPEAAAIVLQVAVYTDGMGTWQARCMSCDWRSRWVRTEARAVDHGKAHAHD